MVPSSLLAAGWAGCDQAYPGDSLGGFEVRGSLVEQSCGVSIVMPNDPLDFEVELRRDGSTIYWRRPGAPAMDGHFSERNQSFELSATSSFLLREASPADGLGPCRIMQQETIGGRLEVVTDPSAPVIPASDAGASDPDAGAPAPIYRFSGENSVSFSVASGADCRDRIGVEQGQFPMLPCRIRYELEGEPMEEAPDW
ncbi:MAG: hypothetical protein IT379_37495 [Deltaproteobacteria bacterium]|nr:hypothetical protein [Deltaproteobacteria bacterium]